MTTDDAAGVLADRLLARDRTVAVAESLTGGLLANRLARTEGAGQWFRGGLVAYAAAVKHEVLHVPDVPVVSEEAAIAMATSARELLGADVALATTGVGGPGAEDGVPAGTVWLAVASEEGSRAALHRFDGDPGAVCEQTCDAALALALDHLGGDAPR